MDNVYDPTIAKAPVTIRLDVAAKAKLHELAMKEDRTVSSLIDLAVREFLERRFQSGIGSNRSGTLRIRHAGLPDTSVLHAYSICAPDDFNKALTKFNLPNFEFVSDRPEWRRLPSDLFSGESDLVESVNWFPIFWHVKRGGSSPRLDWIGPFLQLFVGHCVFVRKDLLKNHFSSDDLTEFQRFRNLASTGKDLSLRSLIAWVQQSKDKIRLGHTLETMWAEAVVGCQLGTDYHIAVRRVAPIIARITNGPLKEDPTIVGVDSLNRGFQELRAGAISGFTGNLLHSATLLADANPVAFLIAGPADLRVPSLNTLAGRKGMFDATSAESPLQTGMPGQRVLGLWGEAVAWFRDQVVNTDSDVNMKQFLGALFPEFMNENENTTGDFVTILKSLLQTWVKWFTDPEEARAFFGEAAFSGSVAGNVSAEDLVKYYEELCELLNPSAQMVAPSDDSKDRALWKFPVLATQSAKSRITSPNSPMTESNRAIVSTKPKESLTARANPRQRRKA
jgi:hypothetical protein